MDTQSGRRWLTVLAEVVGGVVTGFALGVPITFLLGAVVPADSGGGFQDVVAQLAGFFFGYIAGAAIGVTLVGRFMKQRGAWWAALLGAGLGAVIAIALASVGLANVPQLVQITYVLLVALGGALAYTWSASRNAAAIEG